MIVFWPPLILMAWFEASWWPWLNFSGVSVPLTLLVLLYVLWQGWLSLYQTLLLALGAGYLLDVLASPRPGIVLLAMLAAVAVCGVWLPRPKSWWQRLAVVSLGLCIYQLALGLGLSWVDSKLYFGSAALFTLISLIVFVAFLLLGRQIKGWL